MSINDISNEILYDDWLLLKEETFQIVNIFTKINCEVKESILQIYNSIFLFVRRQCYYKLQ